MFLRFAFLQYTVDAVSLDDDDLATVAEDDGSLGSQEEKSVIFSPQPTATATNLATVTNTLGKLQHGRDLETWYLEAGRYLGASEVDTEVGVL